jgi:hypothetical protein
MDLDYSSIIVAEQFIIDAAAYEFVEDRALKHLGPMLKSLRVLESEGLLEVKDYASLIAAHKAAIIKKTEELTANIDPWIAIARRQWRLLRPELEEFQTLYGTSSRRSLDLAHFGVINYLQLRDGRVNQKECERLHGLFERSGRQLKKNERDEFREILKPLVGQMVVNDLLRRKLSAPLIDWDDAQEFYNQLFLGQWTELESPNCPSLQIADYSRQLFKIVIPELKPNSIEEVVAFLRKKRAVQSLRAELWQLLREGGTMSPNWMARLLTEASKAQLIKNKRNRIIKWVGRAIGVVIPGANLFGDVLPALTEVAADVALDMSEAAAEGVSDTKANRRFDWFYALQNIHLGPRKDADGSEVQGERKA